MVFNTRRRRKIRMLIAGVSLSIVVLGGVCFFVLYNNSGIHRESESGFDNPQGFFDYFNGIRTPYGAKENAYTTNYAITELAKARRRKSMIKSGGEEYMWTYRGPGNVGGRTRALILDPDDATHNTWFAASASGGAWKTTNGGGSWQSLTDHFPNLATNCIAMAPSNHTILYIGTGEGYGGVPMVQGNGMFKSTDKGQNWIQISSTIDNKDFQYVNSLIIDQSDPDIVIVATNTGIFKSDNGGDSWIKVYKGGGRRVQGLVTNPKDPNTIYAAVNGLGVIKSYDNGDSWFSISTGLVSGDRYAVDISRVDTNYVFVSIETLTGAQIFHSKNGGGLWYRLRDADGTFSDYLSDLGWYCNAIKAHPFDKNKIFVAGVEFLAIEFLPGTGQSQPEVIRVDTLGTGPFLAFINFGGPFLGGGMSTGTEEGANVQPGDYSSVELRFGPGRSQKAYRFTVPEGEGSGVPSEDYTYHDYIDVPFEVWDTDNNKQLMVSFRDQERDGEFNLIERSPDDDISGREYIFVHGVEYSETPNVSIAQDGGHYYKMTYFFWPTLADKGEWDPENLPLSKIAIDHGVIKLQDATTTIIADYDNLDTLHVDHHDIQIGIINEANKEFMMVEGNDGGLGVSWNNGEWWDQITDGYLTAQVYGVAKLRYEQRYIIGMQDNGTWISPSGEQAGSGSEYVFKGGGDGFEVLWNPVDKNKLISSSQYNGFRTSDDYGQTWRLATNGITSGDGPFISRLAHSVDNPDLIFAISSKGLYKHENFAMGRDPWELINLGKGWSNLTGDTWYYADVQVSLADPSVVWAGSGMYEDPEINIFLSKDYGENFEPVSIYPEREMGYISGIATHPFDPATAYVLFSFAYHPKILRTTDFGETWEDISGFGKDSTSSNGFPDVAVYSLMVHRFNPDWIWAGTEIGIFESTDNGETWYYADNGLPAASIWKMYIQDNQVIVATYGRGIWTAPQWPGAIETGDVEENLKLSTYPNPSTGIINLHFDSEEMGNLKVRVFNNLGQQQRVFEGSKISDVYENQYDLSELTKGSYFIILDMNQKQYSSRITIE